MDSYPATWVLSHLIKDTSLFSGEFRIVDTLLGSSDTQNSIKWAYTDSRGYVNFKHKSFVTVQNILDTFLSDDLPRKEDVYGYYTYINEQFALSKKALYNKILSQSLGDLEALQMLPRSDCSSSARFIVEVHGNNMKFYKQYLIKEKPEKVKLSSHRHCDCMSKMAKEIIRTIEKNSLEGVGGLKSKVKIEEISLMFVEDCKGVLWFLVGLDCKGRPVGGYSESSYKCASAFSSQQGSFSQKSRFCKKMLFNKTLCAGDFCNFLIKSSELKKKTEVDYDHFLQKVSMAYREKHDKELEQIKLALRTDHLLNSRTKKYKGKATEQVSFRCILLGRKILELSGFDTRMIGQVEVNVHEIIETIKIVKEIFEKEEMQERAMKSPFHYYDTTKVCRRCFDMYNLFSLQMKPLPNISTINEIEKKSHTERNINVDDLDDLLEDIQNLKFDMKYGESRDLYSDMIKGSLSTRHDQNDSKESGAEIKKFNRRATIDIKRTEDINYEKLTEQIFPDVKKVYKVKKSSKATFDNYITRLKKRVI